MKNVIFVIIFIIFSSLLFGQISEIDIKKQESKDTVIYSTSDFDTEEIADYIKEKKLKLRVEVGTTFGTSFGSGNYFGTYIAPHFSYKISPRFSLNTGVILSNNYGGYYYNPFYGEQIVTPVSGFTRSFIYIEGAYRLNEKVTVTGAVYKEINLFNNSLPSAQGFNYDCKGMIMGVDYKLGENVFIRGQIEVSNGQSPYRSRSYINPMHNFHSPSFFSPDNPF